MVLESGTVLVLLIYAIDHPITGGPWELHGDNPHDPASIPEDRITDE